MEPAGFGAVVAFPKPPAGAVGLLVPGRAVDGAAGAAGAVGAAGGADAFGAGAPSLGSDDLGVAAGGVVAFGVAGTVPGGGTSGPTVTAGPVVEGSLPWLATAKNTVATCPAQAWRPRSTCRLSQFR
ncbi:MAG: hypothetical protein ACR2GO_04820 [Candidatus Limnocylindria bacterium]